jgi:hypothetical protein
MGMNTVEVDEAAIALQVDQILSDVPPDAPPAAAPAIAGEQLGERELTLEEIQAAAQGYEVGAFLIVSKMADVFAPAWGISHEERKGVASSISMAMAAWFPNAQLPPKWMVLLNVAGSMYSLVESRRDPETGKLKPRRHETKDDSAGASPSTAPA